MINFFNILYKETVMSKLNSKTTRGVAALALLAGSLFATNASAEYGVAKCSVSISARDCTSIDKLRVGAFGTFYVQALTYQARYTTVSPIMVVKVFTVTGGNILYQTRVSSTFFEKQLRGYGSTSTYKVAIRDFYPVLTSDTTVASIYHY